MKEKLLLFALGIIIGLLLIFGIDRCTRNKPTPQIEKKQGKTVLVSTKTEVTFDTLKWIAYYKANTKPLLKWSKPKLIHDTIEVKPLFSPCDSIFASSDTGSIEGVKYAIVDTVSDNRVIGRSIKLQVPQVAINKNTFKTNDSLRVDTVYMETKEKKKRFSVNVGTGYGYSLFSPVPQPNISISIGFKIFSF